MLPDRKDERLRHYRAQDIADEVGMLTGRKVSADTVRHWRAEKSQGIPWWALEACRFALTRLEMQERAWKG